MSEPTSRRSIASPSSNEIQYEQLRLVVTKMVMENFKSYAGTREIGPFHKSFTSIVGPNGSGKSNVIDAIQFVFGKRGQKLRLKKLSELIHNSENHQDLRQASVSVHFCEIRDLRGSDAYDVIPNSELVITRTVDSKSNSKYYINDRISSFKEVTELLKSKGIDLENNRFLILQGEVEQISLMKPTAQNEHETGLLEYIEDIIGTNQYIEQISKAEATVEELSEKRTERLNRLKSVEAEKDSLEGSKNEAVEYLKKKRQLIKNKHLIIQYEKYEADKKLKENEEKRDEIIEKYNSEKEKLKAMKEQLETLELEYQSTKRDHDKIAEELQVSKDKWTSFERKDVKLKQDLKHNKSKKEKLEEDIKSLTEKIAAFEKKINKATKNESKAQESLNKLSEELERAEKSEEQIIKELQSEIEPIRVEKEKKQKELLPISKQVNDIKHKIDVAQSEVDLLLEKSSSVQQQYTQVKETLLQKEEHSEKLVDTISKSNKHQKQIEKRIPELKAVIQELTEQEVNVQASFNRSRTQFQTLTEKMKTAKTQSKLLSAMIEAKESGSIVGICDRLGNLGTIDKKYDIAISTACPALNNIVVETTDCGIKCVELLRRENLGIATFIMLDKVSTPDTMQRLKSKIDTPENVPRLFDLIKFKDEKYKPAFYFALKDTLVVYDLDQASRIAYNNKSNKIWRVVTLKGELIENTGTMSGGGNKIISGGMSASFESDVSQKDIKLAEKTADQDSKKLQDIQNKKKDVISQLSKLEEELSNLQISVSKAEIEKKTIELQIQELKKTLKDLEPQLKEPSSEDDSKIQTLKTSIKKSKKSLVNSEEKYKEIEEEIKKLQEKIDGAGGGKLQKQKERTQLLADQIQETKQKIVKYQVQRENAEKNLDKSQKQLAKDQEELESTDQLIVKIDGELKALEAQAWVVYEQYEEAKKLMQQRDEELSQKEQQYESIKKEVDKSRGFEIDLKNKVDDFERIIKESMQVVIKKTEQLKSLESQVKEFNYESDEEENMVIEQESELVNEDNNEERNCSSESTQLGKRKRSEALSSPVASKKRKETSELLLLEENQLKRLNIRKLNYDITLIESEIEKMKPNLSSIEEFKKKEQEYSKKYQELDEITKERDRIIKERDDLKKKRLNEFMAGFQIITNKLKEIYQMITLGGDAELELVDTFDPFREGIEFSVRPPKKSWKKISNLSGGEKTLSSLALVFALHHYNPTPIYVMDEIDAALDFKNVSIVANYIKERTKNAQFIVISLRNNMFEMADILVGIYKTDNCTKSVTIDPNKISLPDIPSVHNKAMGTPTHEQGRRPLKPRNH